MKKFTFFLAAALFCGSMATFAQDDEVKVTPATDDDGDPTFKFNKDYTYYGIYLDDETKAANLTDDQYIYIGPDDDNGRHFWPWENTYEFPTTTGVNSFGIPGSYMSLKVGNVGWSGAGYANDKGAELNLTGINNKYTFHIAVMSTSSETFDFKIGDGSASGTPADIVLGKTKYDKADPVADFERNGEWYNIDIPMSYIEDQFGLSFEKDNNFVGNILSVLAGGKAGTIINYDAVFFYGPKGTGTGIKDVTANTTNTVAEYYSIDGKKVSAATAKANKGIYIVKKDGKAKKVVID